MTSVLILVVFAKFLANAAAVMPLITALGMIVGRRGNGRFCLWGAKRLLTLTLFLSISGPVYFLGTYFSQVLSFAGPEASLWEPLLEAAGMPYTSSILIWISGGIAVFLARGAMAPLLSAFDNPADRYQIAHVRFPFALCLFAASAFFLTFILINWPFAGIPQEMGWDRAIMAVCRNAARHYFMAFSPAGALALILATHTLDRNNQATPKQKTEAMRWCALWAAAGHLPHAIQAWGLALGLGLRGGLPGQMAPAIHAQILSLSFLTLAMLCWIFLFIFPKPLKPVAWSALILYLLRDASPHIIALCQKF